MIKNSKSLSKAKEPLLHVRISQLLHALQGKPSWDYQYKLLYIEHLSKRTLGWGYSTLQSTCSAWTQSWALTPSQHSPLSRHPHPHQWLFTEGQADSALRLSLHLFLGEEKALRETRKHIQGYTDQGQCTYLHAETTVLTVFMLWTL